MGRRKQPIVLRIRRHGVVLAPALAVASLLAATGVVVLARGGLAAVPGAVLLATAALVYVRAVWRWDRTHVIVTPEELLVVSGSVRRRATGVPLQGGAIVVEQTLLGRLLGYGTIVAGELEITRVGEPRELSKLLFRLAA